MIGTVPGVLVSRADLEPDRVAIQVEGDGLTFGAWEHRSATAAAALVARGLRHGDRAVLRFGTRDWIDYAVAYCGVQRAGGVAVPCSDRSAPAQARHVVTHSGARLLLHAGRVAPGDDLRGRVGADG